MSGESLDDVSPLCITRLRRKTTHALVRATARGRRGQGAAAVAEFRANPTAWPAMSGGDIRAEESIGPSQRCDAFKALSNLARSEGLADHGGTLIGIGIDIGP